MITSLPQPASARERYVDRLQLLVDAVAWGARYDAVPWPLLALNATFYLDSYLPAREYRAALDAALQATARDLPLGRARSHGPDPVPPDAAAVRPVLYRHAFDHAARQAGPLRLLLAQHACEIAEVLPLSSIGPALNLFTGVDDPTASVAVSDSLDPGLAAEAALERLCRGLLTAQLSPERFEDALLLIHAGRRSRELVEPQYLTAHRSAMQHIGLLPTTSRSLKRIRFVQPVDLVRRAVALKQPRAVLVVEAGLVEAEGLTGAAAILLLAALDRVLAVRERQAIRSNGT